MNHSVLDTRRKVMAAIVNGYPGGKDCAAARLGINEKRLENQIYETAGCKPLSDSELHLLEQQNGTHHLPNYICSLYGGVFVPLPHVEELDSVELHQRTVTAAARKGKVDLMIAEALADGEIDASEAAMILALHAKYVAARHEEVQATIVLYAAKD
ncbi:hypothetical protein NK553_18310 [Pseudomonas sp. ZM23]|uniref:Prophage PssSM-01 n=1 Tax=Pseudomonas triclosanedens TaxID=2961893 RepID=A0ABY6ZTU6_9PSED|nr:YmfL family putative regulatory protein [Pseudomonas triclosanedens]MCP8465908.1 hypothetical protein [Pseudomonas triclosanedens]MCP8472229.1 hypothetical protein [Pseudomonas triclosanedens]MCP8477207.1 hypothetical protein [Pseudomonas triclosanedens]WAI47455.1 hypothetical protein OU419_16905 [Pseudomonas triclosanedens]